MNIDNILEFFYKRASTRISDRIKEKQIPHSHIYKDDPKQISWIINNNRTKNNRFLICDAVLGNSENEEINFEYGLIPKLGFQNRKEVLWGSDYEIESYLVDLFRLIWDEVTTDDSEYKIDKELLLCDYIPYAKYSTYWNILFVEKNNYPAILYGIYEDIVIKEIDSSRAGALYYLYNKSKDLFKEKFFQFTFSTKSFHKINKVFKEKFIDQQFVPMLNHFIPDESSLGLRVKNLISADLSTVALMIHNFYKNGIVDNTHKQLVEASSEYIIKLEKIQTEEIKKIR